MVETTPEMLAMRIAKDMGSDLPFHIREWCEKAALAAIKETTEHLKGERVEAPAVIPTNDPRPPKNQLKPRPLADLRIAPVEPTQPSDEDVERAVDGQLAHLFPHWKGGQRGIIATLVARAAIAAMRGGVQ